jgi:hypothetical protein
MSQTERAEYESQRQVSTKGLFSAGNTQVPGGGVTGRVLDRLDTKAQKKRKGKQAGGSALCPIDRRTKGVCPGLWWNERPEGRPIRSVYHVSEKQNADRARGMGLARSGVGRRPPGAPCRI